MNALSFALMMMFVPLQPLPDVEVFRARVLSFADEYGLSFSQSWTVESREFEKPSPFFIKASVTHCSFYINTSRSAQKIWSFLLNTPDVEPDVFVTFVVGHEVLHCLSAAPGVHAKLRSRVESHAMVRFSSRHHFEEVAGDLLGLAFVRRIHLEQYPQLMAQVLRVRDVFGYPDNNFSSKEHINDETVSLIDSVVTE